MGAYVGPSDVGTSVGGYHDVSTSVGLYVGERVSVDGIEVTVGE
jgi:hypothetical protein